MIHSLLCSGNSEKAGQIQRLFDRIFRLLCSAEAVGGKDKGNTGALTGFLVTGGIAHIDWGFQTMATYDGADILGFGFAGISGAEMILEITSKSRRFQENFDIASLTVADDV